MKFIPILVGLLIASAYADPPPGPTPYHDWFAKQWSIGKSFCCNEADGHVLDDSDWRMVGGHYEVRINGNWIQVPATAMVDSARGGPNPTGHAVIWYVTGSEGGIRLYCFAQGFEG
jgi:hypothetical protein